jgi:hypothetical protein
MAWSNSWLIPTESDALTTAMLTAVRAVDGTALIPDSEVTPHLLARLNKVAGIDGTKDNGSFECMVNNRWVVVEVAATNGGYLVRMRPTPAV